MIIMKVKKGFYICRSPVNNSPYAIIQEPAPPDTPCYNKCYFAGYCKKFLSSRKPMLKYFGIDKSCNAFLEAAGFNLDMEHVIYFKHFRRGL